MHYAQQCQQAEVQPVLAQARRFVGGRGFVGVSVLAPSPVSDGFFHCSGRHSQENGRNVPTATSDTGLRVQRRIFNSNTNAHLVNYYSNPRSCRVSYRNVRRPQIISYTMISQYNTDNGFHSVLPPSGMRTR